MLLQTTYQDKGTQTDESQESKDIFTILTTLSLQMESMGKRLQQLESQQHDYKNAELSRSEDSKLPEVEGDVGKLQKPITQLLYIQLQVQANKLAKSHISM
uniref:Putative translocation transactivator (Truncated) (Hypothetical protein) n=1 Tax=Nicotiana tabacum TaxID=4097 RepID=Q93YE8_TOBAC|nr:hypothetical protein [Nicotiana tabacum]